MDVFQTELSFKLNPRRLQHLLKSLLVIFPYEVGSMFKWEEVQEATTLREETEGWAQAMVYRGSVGTFLPTGKVALHLLMIRSSQEKRGQGKSRLNST